MGLVNVDHLASQMRREKITCFRFSPWSFSLFFALLSPCSSLPPVVDSWMPLQLSGFISQILSLASVAVLPLFATPYFLIPLVPVLYLLIRLMSFYRTVSRELKRVESITRSPVYSCFGESLVGASTIRAFGAVEMIRQKNRQLVQTNSIAFFTSQRMPCDLSVTIRDRGRSVTGETGELKTRLRSDCQMDSDRRRKSKRGNEMTMLTVDLLWFILCCFCFCPINRSWKMDRYPLRYACPRADVQCGKSRCWLGRISQCCRDFTRHGLFHSACW